MLSPFENSKCLLTGCGVLAIRNRKKPSEQSSFVKNVIKARKSANVNTISIYTNICDIIFVLSDRMPAGGFDLALNLSKRAGGLRDG